nr:hypothetical protein [Tanacetum cinerariifolium]
MAKLILMECVEKAQIESNLAKNTNDDINIELSKEFLMELQSNAYHGMFDEDVVDHIAKWISEGDGKITTWEELVEKFLFKFYPESRDGKDEMLDKGDNWRIDPLEFISRVNSSLENHIKVNGRTKKESNYGNPPNTATDSFFNPYLRAQEEYDVKKRDELRQMKCNDNNKNDEQPNKRVCKAEKSEAIKYSLGPNKEFIAIKRCEYNA